MDGSVDKTFAYAYFEPTPFAEWSISLDPKLVDYSKVTKMTMSFAGTAIGAVGASGGSAGYRDGKA